MMKKIQVEIYTKEGCHLCDVAEAVLKKVQQRYDFQIKQVNITQGKQIYEEYKEQIPVIFINGHKAFKYQIDEKQLVKKLKNANRRRKGSTIFRRLI